MDRKNIITGISVTASLAVITAHVLLGYWSFPQADDFFAYIGRDQGVFPAVAVFYAQWSGRFSSYFLIALTGAFNIMPYRTHLAVMASLALFAVAIGLVLWRLNDRQAKATIFDVAFLFLALPYPIKVESFYWLNGNIVYAVPISITCLVLAFLDYRLKREFLAPAGLFVLFIALGAFNEQFSIFLILCLCGYVAAERRDLPPFLSRRLLAMLAGTGAGLAIDLFSEGNYIRHRMHMNGQVMDLAGVTRHSMEALRDMLLFFFSAMVAYGFLKSYFVPPASPGFCTSRRSLAGYLAISCGACFCAFFIVIYGYNNSAFSLQPRALLTPYLLMFAVALVLSRWLSFRYTLPPALRPFKGALLFPILLLVSPLPSQGLMDLAASFTHAPAQRAAVLVQCDAAIQAKKAGRMSLVVSDVPRQRSMALYHVIGSLPDYWRNESFADFFGLEQVRTP